MKNERKFKWVREDWLMVCRVGGVTATINIRRENVYTWNVFASVKKYGNWSCEAAFWNAMMCAEHSLNEALDEIEASNA